MFLYSCNTKTGIFASSLPMENPPTISKTTQPPPIPTEASDGQKGHVRQTPNHQSYVTNQNPIWPLPTQAGALGKNPSIATRNATGIRDTPYWVDVEASGADNHGERKGATDREMERSGSQIQITYDPSILLVDAPNRQTVDAIPTPDG